MRDLNDVAFKIKMMNKSGTFSQFYATITQINWQPVLSVVCIVETKARQMVGFV